MKIRATHQHKIRLSKEGRAISRWIEIWYLYSKIISQDLLPASSSDGSASQCGAEGSGGPGIDLPLARRRSERRASTTLL